MRESANGIRACKQNVPRRRIQRIESGVPCFGFPIVNAQQVTARAELHGRIAIGQREDDAIRNNHGRWNRHIHRIPGGRQDRFAGLLFYFERHDTAVGRIAVREGKLGVGCGRSPRRSVEPARSRGILPRGESAPETLPREIDFLVREKWAAVIET